MKIISKQRKYEIKQKALNGKLVVLSLFDGISCAQIALKALNVKPAKYYASEIKKKAINVCLGNFAETEQVGDITKWQEWLPDILGKYTVDLVVCSSPCQNFSKRGLDGDKLKLFFVALEIIEYIEDKQKKSFYFLFDGEQANPGLGNYLSTNAVLIDNAVFDAGHRNRLYFTNIAARFNVDLFDNDYCYSEIPSLTDVRPRPFPFDKNPSGDLFLSEKQLAYCFKRQEPFKNGDKSPFLILKNEIPKCITTKVNNRLGGNLVAMKCAKANSYKELGYSFRRLTVNELKLCNGIPEWYSFGNYSYSSICELIGNGFGIGTIKYILNHILK